MSSDHGADRSSSKGWLPKPKQQPAHGPGAPDQVLHPLSSSPPPRVPSLILRQKKGPRIREMNTKSPRNGQTTERRQLLKSLLRTIRQLGMDQVEVEDLCRSSDWDSAASLSWCCSPQKELQSHQIFSLKEGALWIIPEIELKYWCWLIDAKLMNYLIGKGSWS